MKPRKCHVLYCIRVKVKARVPVGQPVFNTNEIKQDNDDKSTAVIMKSGTKSATYKLGS